MTDEQTPLFADPPPVPEPPPTAAALALRLDFKGHAVRVIGNPSAPEWVAADVCKALGLKGSASIHLRKCRPSEKRLTRVDLGSPQSQTPVEPSPPGGVYRIYTPSQKGMNRIHTLGGTQQVLTVTEPGLYRLIFRSDKPEAEAFQNWVFSEVLPSIRAHGCFPPPQTPAEPREGRDAPLQPRTAPVPPSPLPGPATPPMARCGRPPGTYGVPSYRLHKASGQAVVTLEGRTAYLGKFNTPQSRAEYARVIAGWADPTPAPPAAPPDPTLPDLVGRLPDLIRAVERVSRPAPAAVELTQQTVRLIVREIVGQVFEAGRTPFAPAGAAERPPLALPGRTASPSLEGEQLIRLDDVPDLPGMPRRPDGRKTSPATVRGWVAKGVRSGAVKLEVTHAGGRLCTSGPAVWRFFDRRAARAPDPGGPGTAESYRRAAAELEYAGI